MPFDYQSNKLRKTLSLRRRSTGTPPTTVSGGSALGDQLCRQLEAQLRSLPSDHPSLQAHALTRSRSLSGAPTLAARPSRPCLRGEIGRQSPTLYSWTGSDSITSPSLCHSNRRLSHKSSTSSSSSYRSIRSLESSSKPSTSPVTTPNLSPVRKVKVEGTGWTDILKLKHRLESLISPQDDALVSQATHPPLKGRSKLRSKLRKFQSGQTDKSEPRTQSQPVPEPPKLIAPTQTNLYELPVSQTKDLSVLLPHVKPSHNFTSPSSSPKVKFDAASLMPYRDPPAPWMPCQRPLNRQPSIKRSLPVSCSLHTIPEDTRSQIYLLSPNGMTL